MASQYKLTEIFTFEEITRNYCVSQGKTSLKPKTLINFGLLAGNIEYADYIVYKQNIIMEDLIDKKLRPLGLTFNITSVIDPDYYIESRRDQYEALYDRYSFRTNKNLLKTKVEQIIDLVLQDGVRVDILYYIYFRKEENLKSYLALREDEIHRNNRKFYII